jgi:hypothetical protein
VKRFNAVINGGTYINVEATRMELVDNMIRVWNKDEFVACVDISTVLTAHISERGELREQ